ncbi:TetR family transcriptional regulator [Nonomuraea sp. NPDC050310]|uniref:TetR family transcriptional regulator n=1 Tax=Nonomuraea sp. NPDC050310 TaxID=3154935 RepID=UPI0033EB89EC
MPALTKALTVATFTRCVARYGLDGATLQRVADEAGTARGHICHHAGNREELRELFASASSAGTPTRSAS